MAAPPSIFCAHKKLRTACPECRPPPPPPAPPKAPARKKAEPKAESATDEGDGEGSSGRRGPGKPLLPQKRRQKAPTREEAEKAEAWWVKDR